MGENALPRLVYEAFCSNLIVIHRRGDVLNAKTFGIEDTISLIKPDCLLCFVQSFFSNETGLLRR
jgi:hypothetical protein